MMFTYMVATDHISEGWPLLDRWVERPAWLVSSQVCWTAWWT